MRKVLSFGPKKRPPRSLWRILLEQLCLIALLAYACSVYQQHLMAKHGGKAADLPHVNFDMSATDRWGVIDKSGRFLIEPAYHDIYSYGANYAVVGNFDPNNSVLRKNNSILDRNGKCLFTAPDIDVMSDGVAFFSDGPIDAEAPIIQQKARYGIADSSGHVVCPPTFMYVNAFEDNVAIVNKSWGNGTELIDRSGRILLEFPKHVDAPSTVSEGLLVVKDNGADGNDVIYDLHGNAVVHFDDTVTCENFSEGLAAATKWVKVKPKAGEQFSDLTTIKGYIDKRGKFVITPKFETAEDFSEGLAAVFVHSRWEYIDRTGKVVIQMPDDCSDAGSFSEGYAAVAMGGEKNASEPYGIRQGAKWGFIDKSGKMIIPPQFYAPANWQTKFSNGLALVASGSDAHYRFGYIDRTGRWVIGPTFKDACGFNGGVAAVCIGPEKFSPEQWSAAGKTGTWIHRGDLFQQFCRDYPIVGMSRAELYAALGQGDESVGNEISYPVTTWWCANVCSDACFKLKDGNVVAWCFERFGRDSTWSTKNDDYHAGAGKP
ncbi:MAG TPA: WG repeat-containing protein [Trichormus sp.]